MQKLYSYFKAIRFLLLLVLLVLSLVTNVAIMASTAAFHIASAAFEAVSGRPSVATRNAARMTDLRKKVTAEAGINKRSKREIAHLTDNLATERKAKAALQNKVTNLTSLVNSERIAQRKLRGEVARLSNDLVALKASQFVTYRGKKMLAGDAARLTAASIASRASKSASINVGSMVGEAIPYLGTSVIVGVTALEVRDLCETVKEMNALRDALNPQTPIDDEDITVCSMRVPTRHEIWETTKGSPGRAWAKAKDLTPTLEDIKSIEVPDIDWTGFLVGTQTSLSGFWDWASEGTSDAASRAMDGIMWWSDGEELE